MRLTPDQVHAIRQTAQRLLSAGARVSVFGSMALDDRRGGDIDLFFKTDNPLPNRANTPRAPIFEIAKRTGVPL